MIEFLKTEDEVAREFVGEWVMYLVKEFDKHPFKINDGDCKDFAHRLVTLINGLAKGSPAEIVDSGDLDGDNVTHFFVKYKDRYYDAEEPYGVKDHLHLPIYQRALRNWE